MWEQSQQEIPTGAGDATLVPDGSRLKVACVKTPTRCNTNPVEILQNRTDRLSSKSSSDQNMKNFLHWQHLQTIHMFSFIVRGDLTKNLPEKSRILSVTAQFSSQTIRELRGNFPIVGNGIGIDFMAPSHCSCTCHVGTTQPKGK